MRRDDLYLDDILEAADEIGEFVEGLDFESFVASKMARAAVLQKLTVIGEAAARVSLELRAISPDVPWRGMIGFRNIAVHAYFAINWEIVWSAAVRDVPALPERIREIQQSG